MTKLEYKSIYDVVGAAQEVHATLGRGLAEPIYQEALAIEMHERGEDKFVLLTQNNYKSYISE